MRKMRWDCKKDGCFNEKCRLKLGVFDDCFPRGIGFTDVDGMVEINSYLLCLEWKAPGTELPKGQRIAYERSSANGFVSFICIEGDAETMTVESMFRYHLGQLSRQKTADIDRVKQAIRNWVIWAERVHKKHNNTDHRVSMASAWFHFSGHLRLQLCEAAGVGRWCAGFEWSDMKREKQVKILKAWNEVIGQ